MARNSQDAPRFGISVDVTTAGINVSGDGSVPARQAESGRREASGFSAPGHADGLQSAADPPSLGMAASFAASMAKFAASGFKTVDEHSHELRMGVCGPCEYRNAKRCTFCGCFVAEKAWLPHEDCPIGRWPA